MHPCPRCRRHIVPGTCPWCDGVAFVQPGPPNAFQMAVMYGAPPQPRTQRQARGFGADSLQLQLPSLQNVGFTYEEPLWHVDATARAILDAFFFVGTHLQGVFKGLPGASVAWMPPGTSNVPQYLQQQAQQGRAVLVDIQTLQKPTGTVGLVFVESPQQLLELAGGESPAYVVFSAPADLLAAVRQMVPAKPGPASPATKPAQPLPQPVPVVPATSTPSLQTLAFAALAGAIVGALAGYFSQRSGRREV